jgi:hypothetical protein
MSFVMVFLVLLLVVGAIALFFLPRPGRRDDLDVTDRDRRPPAHPEAPLPGSATRRRDQGQL